MKILHISDLYLGRNFFGKSRLEEHTDIYYSKLLTTAQGTKWIKQTI
ncbi:hypothetical protein [Arcobacter sp.]